MPKDNEVRVYKDTPHNRKLNRVGKPVCKANAVSTKQPAAKAVKTKNQYKSPEFVPSDWDLSSDEEISNTAGKVE